MSDERFEVKFTAPIGDEDEAFGWVQRHIGRFRRLHPPRQISNIYFDTYNLDCYADNLSGTSSRYKVRYRWYGDQSQIDRGALEIKLRRNRLGRKTVTPIEMPIDLKRQNWRHIRQTISKDLPDDSRVLFEFHPQPVIINRYHRQYFATGDGVTRMTVDSDQSVYDQLNATRPNLKFKSNITQYLIFELKFAASDRDRALRSLDNMPFRLTRNSKYAIAVQAILNR